MVERQGRANLGGDELCEKTNELNPNKNIGIFDDLRTYNEPNKSLLHC